MSNLKELAARNLADGEISVEKQRTDDLELLKHLVDIWDIKSISEALQHVSPSSWGRDYLSKVLKGKAQMELFNSVELKLLRSLLPSKPKHFSNPKFRFIDLFAGIGGIRAGFEKIGGKCVFTSEWNKYSQKTYKANWYSDDEHIFNEDIRDVTLSNDETISEEDAYAHIDQHVPDHDVLLAGFPCQPFSLAGVSKKNSLGRAHGFECEAQGTLFFDVARILKSKRPSCFLLENVKNLKSHDKGKTFKVILETLDELGYWVADSQHTGSQDPKIIDAKLFVPQHRERIVLVGFRKDLNIQDGFSLTNLSQHIPTNRPSFAEILDADVDEKYTLTPKLWGYLYEYAKKHQEKGNGFGFGLVNPKDSNATARTLSARYHKDGSEILIDHKGWSMDRASVDFWDEQNQMNRPRRLTPRECARLMGFDKPQEECFRIPVSDTQAYRQFGNSVAVPVFEAVAKLMEPYIADSIAKESRSKAS